MKIFDTIIFVIACIIMIFHLWQADPTPKDVISCVFWGVVIVSYKIEYGPFYKKENNNLED